MIDLLKSLLKQFGCLHYDQCKVHKKCNVGFNYKKCSVVKAKIFIEKSKGITPAPPKKKAPIIIEIKQL